MRRKYIARDRRQEGEKGGENGRRWGREMTKK